MATQRKARTPNTTQWLSWTFPEKDEDTFFALDVFLRGGGDLTTCGKLFKHDGTPCSVEEVLAWYRAEKAARSNKKP